MEVTIPAEGNEKEIITSWSLNNVISEIEENTQYFILAKISAEGITGELTGKSLIYIQDWNTDEDINGNANPDKPQSVNLATNGDFEELTSISVSNSVPTSAKVWYGLKTTITS